MRINVSKTKIMNIFHFSLREMLLFFRHLSGSERELVAEAEGDGGGVLPGEGLELGAGLVGVDLKFVVVVIHGAEIEGVALAQIPFQTEGSADAVDVGVGVAEELVVTPRISGAVVGGTALGIVEGVAQLYKGVRLHGSESSVLDHQA